MDVLSRGNQMLRSRLAYCENSNTPFSSRSLEYHEEKTNVQDERKRRDTSIKKPCGRLGYDEMPCKHNHTSIVKYVMKNSNCKSPTTIYILHIKYI